MSFRSARSAGRKHAFPLKFFNSKIADCALLLLLQARYTFVLCRGDWTIGFSTGFFEPCTKNLRDLFHISTSNDHYLSRISSIEDSPWGHNGQHRIPHKLVSDWSNISWGFSREVTATPGKTYKAGEIHAGKGGVRCKTTSQCESFQNTLFIISNKIVTFSPTHRMHYNFCQVGNTSGVDLLFLFNLSTPWWSYNRRATG